MLYNLLLFESLLMGNDEEQTRQLDQKARRTVKTMLCIAKVMSTNYKLDQLL